MHREAANLGEDQIPVIQVGAAAVLLVGEGAIAPAPLERGEPRRLSTRQPTEERLIGPVQTDEHIFYDIAVDGRVLRERYLQVLQLGFLLGAAGALALPAAPPGEAL